MANLVPHLGLRFTSSAEDPETGIIATYDLAMDSPRNYQTPGGRLNAVRYIASPVPEAILIDTIRRDSPAGRATKGKGLLLKIDIDVEWKTGKAPDVADCPEGELGTVENDGWAIAGYLSRTMSGVTDGASVYCWLSTNYQWQNPLAEEAWIRVVPDPRTVKTGYRNAKFQTWGLSCTLLSDKNYVSITPTNWRRGFEYDGAGTINVSGTAVTGSGTAFLTDFIHGDRIKLADGTLVGTVDSIASDTALTLMATAASQTGEAYVVWQRSNGGWSVPIYALEEFSEAAITPKAVVMYGLLADRPAAAAVGRAFYYATDENLEYFSDGTRWIRREGVDPRKRYMCWQVMSEGPLAGGYSVTVANYGGEGTDVFGADAITQEDDRTYMRLDPSLVANVGRWGSLANGSARGDTCIEHKPIATFYIRTGDAAANYDISNVRIHVGLYKDNPYTLGNLTMSHLEFRYLTAVDGTAFWRCSSGDGAARTLTATTTPVTADTAYKLVIDCTDPAAVVFLINGVVVATHTTNLPAATDFLFRYGSIEPTDANARKIKFSKFEIETF